MAMMEHVCPDCGHMVFNNYPRTPGTCVKCGGMDMRHFADESFDDFIDPDDVDEYDPDPEDED